MYNYIYMEDYVICDICYEKKQNYFKCVRCSFNGCCRCFNNFYFEDKSKCPICRLLTH